MDGPTVLKRGGTLAFATILSGLAGSLLFAKGLPYVILSVAAITLAVPHAWLFTAAGAIAVLAAELITTGMGQGRVTACLLPLFTTAVIARNLRRHIEYRWQEKKAAPNNGKAYVEWGAGRWLFLLTLFLLYPAAKLSWASIQVQRFCDSVEVGSAPRGLVASGNSYGLEVYESEAFVSRSGEHHPAAVVAREAWGFGRHFCRVSHDGTSVTDTHRYFLD